MRDQIPVFRTQDLAGTAEIVCTIVQELDRRAPVNKFEGVEDGSSSALMIGLEKVA